MASFFDSGPFPDWKDIQRFLGRDIPWNMVEKWGRGNDPAWLNQVVGEIMKKAKTHESARPKGWLQAETVKDQKYVTIKMLLAPETDFRQLQLFATSEHLKVTGLPGASRHQSIRFPCLVYAKTGAAALKDNRLQVRFRRRPPEKAEYELFIRS